MISSFAANLLALALLGQPVPPDKPRNPETLGARDFRDVRDSRDQRAGRVSSGRPVLARTLSGGVLPELVGAGLLPFQGATVVFKRDSIKWCRTSTSTYVQLALHTPCVDFDGLHMERSATNQMTRSQSLELLPTQSGGNPGAAAPVVTANACTAPDGTVTAERVDYPDTVTGSGQLSIIRSGVITLSQGWPYSGSIWVKGYAGSSGTIYFSLYDTQWNTAPLNFTATWKRVELHRTPNATSGEVLIGHDRRDAVQVGQPALSVCLWQAQLEGGTDVTSPILTTTAAATRNGDIMRLNFGAPIGTRMRVQFRFKPGQTDLNGLAVFGTGSPGIDPSTLRHVQVGFGAGGRLYRASSFGDGVTTQTGGAEYPIGPGTTWSLSSYNLAWCQWDDGKNFSCGQNGNTLVSHPLVDPQAPGSSHIYMLSRFDEYPWVSTTGWVTDLKVMR